MTPPPSRRLQSLIVTVATVVLAVVALITKWTIVKSIHQDIIYKYNNNQSLFFQRPPICRVIGIQPEFNVITFPVACLLFILFSVNTKRKSLQRDKWFGGYIGLPIPLDFFTHVKRTFNAVIFAIFADELFEIANELFFGSGAPSDEGLPRPISMCASDIRTFV